MDSRRSSVTKIMSDSEDENSFVEARDAPPSLPIQQQQPKQVSEACLVLAKLLCILAGLGTLILMKVFLHAHH